MEHSTVITFIDSAETFLLKYYHSFLKIYDDLEGNHKDRKFLYDLNKQIKIFSENAKKKSMLDAEYKDLKVPFSKII